MKRNKGEKIYGSVIIILFFSLISFYVLGEVLEGKDYVGGLFQSLFVINYFACVLVLAFGFLKTIL